MNTIKRLLSISFLLLSVISSYGQETERKDTLTASRVTTDRRRFGDAASQTGLKRIDAEEFNRGYALFGSPDVIKTLQTLPGVAAGSELMSGLYVHGGDGRDNLFLLDGAPIYQATHLIGLFSAFNTDVTESVDFYKSGFPARYGGRASSVIDVRLREGDYEKFKGCFSLGSADGRIQFEGPIIKGKTSFNVALRRSWTDILTTPLIALLNWNNRREYGEEAEQVSAAYHFSDFNAGVSHRFSKDNVLTFNVYGGLDKMRMSMMERNFFEEEGNRYEGYTKTGTDVRWGNLLSVLSWHNSISKQWYLESSAFFSRNFGHIGISVEDDSWDEGENYISVNQITRSLSDIAGARAFAVYTPSSSQQLRFGGEMLYKSYSPKITSGLELKVPGYKYDDGTEKSCFYDAVEGSLYLEDEFSLFSFIKANIGARASIFHTKSKTYAFLEPRVSLKAQCGPSSSFRFSYTEMNQSDHSIATSYLDLPTDTWMPSTAKIKPIHSKQFAAGFYSRLPFGLDLTVEGWYKTLEHLYEYGGVASLYPPIHTWETEFTEGRGRSWGLEALAELQSGPLTASVGYTLSWSQRFFEEFYFNWYPDRNDNRHKIDIMVNYRFGKKFELYGGWHFHSGNNMTGESHLIYNEYGSYTKIYGKPNSLKLPPYHRLDLGFNWYGKTRKGRDKVLNISLYNAYCRMNPFFASIEPVYVTAINPDTGLEETKATGKYKGVAIGIIPIIPSISYTLKF